MKTVRFYTLGCKVNQYDTQSIRERFLQRGFKEIPNANKAGIYVINTCTVTSSADRQSRNVIRNCAKANPDALIIVTGCLAAKDTAALINLKEIDFIISKKFFPERVNNFSGHTRAFLKIQDGCNNFCSYCKVPFVRGVSRSRPLNEIAADAGQLAKNGFKEIVLTGICLGSYGRDLSPAICLIDALDALEKIGGVSRLRLSSIEAGDISLKLIKKIADSEKVCRHLHIPVQSGEDTILKKMNRSYSKADYLRLIKKIKRIIPDIAITTDVIVGFPGESKANFMNTIELIKEIVPLKVHIFPYSKRAGTYAADNLKDEVNPLLIKERVLSLKNISGDCALFYKKQFINKNLKVLFEERCKEKEGYWQGYADNYIKVLAKSKQDLRNCIIPVKLKTVKNDYIIAEYP